MQQVYSSSALNTTNLSDLENPHTDPLFEFLACVEESTKTGRMSNQPRTLSFATWVFPRITSLHAFLVKNNKLYSELCCPLSPPVTLNVEQSTRDDVADEEESCRIEPVVKEYLGNRIVSAAGTAIEVFICF